MDLFVFDPLPPHCCPGGAVTYADSTERGVVALEPNSSYWLWIGTYDATATLPQGYTIDICARTAFP